MSKTTKRKYSTRSGTNKNTELEEQEDNEIPKKTNVKKFKEQIKTPISNQDEDYEVVAKGSSAITPETPEGNSIIVSFFLITSKLLSSSCLLDSRRREIEKNIEKSVIEDIATYGKKKNSHTRRGKRFI